MTDLHTQGLFIVIDPDGQPVFSTAASTAYSARATYVRGSNRPWRVAAEAGCKIVRLKIVEVVVVAG